MKELKQLEAKSGGILCDTYVDRTFHWKKGTPFTKEWCGFVHHTFDTTFSSYNCVELLKNKAFQDSLPLCKGLFVFTNELKSRWELELSTLSFDIPVVKLDHPTETPDTVFTLEKYNANSNKKLVQVGAWLRNVYSIFALNNGNGPLILEDGEKLAKCALQGPFMEQYFKPSNFFASFFQDRYKTQAEKKVKAVSITTNRILSPNGELPIQVTSETDNEDDNDDNDDGICRGGMSRDYMCRDALRLNKYVLGSLKMLEKYDNSVSVLPFATNSQYDTLLSENIVFVDLVDAGAVNTLIECIVRCTPIVITRLPATIDVLGEDYPLFFDAISDIHLTQEKITSAYNYLVSMDKTFLTGNNFLDELTQSTLYKSL